MRKKGWTTDEIQKTLDNGVILPHNRVNNIHPGNRMIRIHNYELNKSLILDIDANEIIQLGKPGYKF